MESQAPSVTTPDAEKTPEQIEREMAQTRGSITEKVVALENQVVGTFQSATNAVTDTVEAVKSLVSNAPSAVSDTVKQSVAAIKQQLDVTGCVRSHPWTSVGCSAAGGFLLGYLLGGSRERRPVIAGQAVIPPQPAYQPPRPPSEPGMFDELLGQITREVKRLAQEAIASTSAALKQTITTGAPKLVDAAASHVRLEPAGTR